jgi:L,D-transpeptidase catalytic domain
VPGSSSEGPSPSPAPSPRRRSRWLDLGLSAALLLIAALVLAPMVGGWKGPERDSVVSSSGAPSSGLMESPGPRPEPPIRPCARESLVGTQAAKRAVARVSPSSASRPIHTFARISPLGVPQVFLLQKQVLGSDGEPWFRALLPVRPNGETGFIRGKDLAVSATPYRLTLDRRRFRLQLHRGCAVARTFRVGIGTGSTPTPVGRFYLTSLFKIPDRGSVYGPYAYGLSGYSEVLRSWKLGGIIGLHGTNDPGSVGKRSSHGCIRLHNRDIRALVKILPLGTPIEIS